jgi:hypothetical protein
MRLRIDEAGDFSYHDPALFRASVIAGVAIPDSQWPAIQRFVADRRQQWDMPELKAKEMDGAQLEDVADFIASKGLATVVVATDSTIFSLASQKEWRCKQVEIFRGAVERSQRIKTDPLVAGRVQRLMTRMHNSRHIKEPNYLQYAILAPWLLSRLMSASLLVNRNLDPDADDWLMDIVMDARDGADPGKAGNLLRDSVEAIYAGDDKTALRMPGEWSTEHPFKVKNTDPEVATISVRQVLAKGIRTDKSENDPGLQLADFVAHLALSVIRDSDDQNALTVWRKLLQVIVDTDEEWPLKVWAWPGPADAASEARYARLAR